MQTRSLATAALAVVVAVAMAGQLAAAGPAEAATPKPPSSAVSATGDPAAAAPRPPHPSAVAPAQRDKVLGAGWQSSQDLAWTTAGDATGLHLLVADERSGYAWRTVATLSEPGADTDQWIGNACLTGSGRRAVVVYAPRTFTNNQLLSARGGFTAVVDLITGAVTKLPVTTSLAYFNPGCGAAETAVLTQGGAEDKHQTRLLTLDTASGKLSAPVTVPGQLTSAVPVAGGMVAAAGAWLVHVDGRGHLTRMAAATSTPFRLHPDATGAVVYLDFRHGRARVRRTAGSTSQTLADGPLTSMNVTSGAGGRVFLTGRPTRLGALPKGVTAIASAPEVQVSTAGHLVLDDVSVASPLRRPVGTPVDPTRREPVNIKATVTSTRSALAFTVQPTAAPVVAASTGTQRRAATASVTGSATSAVDDDRWCSIPRNDPHTMVYQPTPRQVEWAADMAVQNQLHTARPANFKDFGLPSYAPQEMFPDLVTHGTDHVPVQVLLGILAQESNLWQASGHVLSGEFGNPLVGNFYGQPLYDANPANDWEIHWDQSDCGYGVAQVTDGMRMAGHEKPGETALRPDQQRAVAMDYATNIAAALQILEIKWNQLFDAKMLLNGGDGSMLENWFLAAWAYNSGLHPDQGDQSPWGVGWANNPINPNYPANRHPFLDNNTYSDAAHPQDWPYEEKVMGWAAWPISTPDGAGYRAAWWNSADARTAVKPPPDLFCDASNSCVPGAQYPNSVGDVPGPCSRPDLECWYHQSATWKPDCATTCGHELIRFDPGYAEQADGTHYPPECDAFTSLPGLPSGSVIVDDVPAGTPAYRCGGSTSSDGTFGLQFNDDGTGALFPSKINFHQIGGGYGGHFWFAQTIPAPSYGKSPYQVTATWTPSAGTVSGWTRIMVHTPPNGAWTRQADYQVNLGNGTVKHRILNQVQQFNSWVDIGVFNLSGSPSVSLSNITQDGAGQDIAYDAIAFVHAAQPTVNYVALGDSYSAGEGNQPYDADGDFYNAGEKDACHRSAKAYPQQVKLPGHAQPVSIESGTLTGGVSFHFLACSGAITPSVTNDAVDSPPTADDTSGVTRWGKPDAHWGEVAQVDTGYLDETTTLVSLTIGGNDSRFSDIVGACGLHDCAAQGFVLSAGGHSDPAPLRDFEPTVMGELQTHLVAVYRAIHRRAPNAKIIVLGYPQLFADNPSGTCGLSISVSGNPNPIQLGLIDLNEEAMLNQFATLFTSTISGAVQQVAATGVDINFLDPTPLWRNGDHWSCGNVGTQFTNGITGPSWSGSTTPGECAAGGVTIPVPTSPSGGCEVPGSGSFHPTPAGHAAEANLINSFLAGV